MSTEPRPRIADPRSQTHVMKRLKEVLSNWRRDLGHILLECMHKSNLNCENFRIWIQFVPTFVNEKPNTSLCLQTLIFF